jgi:hypothetical protein
VLREREGKLKRREEERGWREAVALREREYVCALSPRGCRLSAASV